MKNIKRMAKTVGALSLLGCAVMTPQFAMAADADAGWIGGLNIGQSIANIDDVQMRARLAQDGLVTPLWDISDHANAFKIFAGYKFNKNFALEGGYFDLGKYSIRMTTVPAGTYSANIALRGLNLDAVGMLPFTEKFSGFGRVGLNYAEARDGFASTGAVVGPMDPNPSKKALNMKVGLGLQYDFNDSVGMRGEWERYRIDDAVGNLGDINMYSLGLVVKFGEKPAPARKAEPAPVAKQEAVMCIVPIVAKTQKYCSILDLTFEINTEEIQRDDKEKLKHLGTYMTKYPDTTAVIEGHTDNVGSNEDNMKLSKQRADSVVTYLVNELHIANTRLTAVGYGESRPIADNSTEAGKRQNRRIDAVIACVTDIEGLNVQPARITMAMELDFDLNKADIKPEYVGELRKVANYLKANPTVTATVEGHTANVKANSGSEAMKLSNLRAQNVANFLVDNLSVPRSQVRTEAFGDTRRIAYNTSVEGQEENRRVNIIFNYKK